MALQRTERRGGGRLGMATLLAVALAQPLAAQRSERYEVPGDDIAIYNLVGEVQITRGSGSAVVVEVTSHGADASRLQIETGRIEGRSTLRVIFPSDDIRYRRSRWDGWKTEIRVRDDGTFGDSDWHQRNRGRRVRISSRDGDFEAAADLRILVPPGRRLAVYLAAGEVGARDVEGDLLIESYQASVSTSNTAGSLVIDTGSGSVDVSNAEGDVLIDTGSGSVDVTNVMGSRLLVDTGSGGVTVAGVAVDDLNVDTGSGGIEVTGARARDVLLDTGSGSVDLQLTDHADRVVVDTGSGSVTVTVPDSFGARVEIDTGSGGIDIDFPLQLQRWERTHVSGQIGDGQGRLEIDTGSGSVRIRRGRGE